MAQSWRRAIKPVAATVIGLWLANTSLFSTPDPANTRLLAHRGLHQTYIGPPPGNDTCTAAPIAVPTHGFIENTLASMGAAFDLGAAVVEIDIHLTPDGQFAVFHDWTLECRTNGTGQTNETTLADLQALDAGWGYATKDGAFPLRGTGIGAIPNLKDVFAAFPDGQFLINFKSNNAAEGTELAALIQTLGADQQVFGVYGGPRPVASFTAAMPERPGYTFDSVKRCLLWYTAVGWAGYVPGACHNTQVMVPLSHARLLWGWPHRFTGRMAAAGSTVILVAEHRDGQTRGIDTPRDLSHVPHGFDGYLWTNDLPAISARQP